MTLVYTTQTTTVTTTVETAYHVVGEAEFITLLSAFRSEPLPVEPAVRDRIEAEVVASVDGYAELTAILNGDHDAGGDSGGVEDVEQARRVNAAEWVAKVAPRVEHEYVETVAGAVLR